MPQFTANFEEFDAPWDAVVPTWSLYATTPYEAPSTPMAGPDGSHVSSTDYLLSQSHQLEPYDLSTYLQPPDLSQEPTYATCSDIQCRQCLERMGTNTGVAFDTTAPEWSQSFDQPLDPQLITSAPPHLQVPLTFPLTTSPTALPTIPSTIPASDTGLGSSTIPIDPYWEAGLAHPQLFEENWYNNPYLLDDTSSHVSPPHMNLPLTFPLTTSPTALPTIPPTIPTSDTGLGSSMIPMDPHWEAGLAHPQPFEENWYNNAYLFDDTSSHVSPSHMNLPLTFPLITPPTALPTIPPTIPTSDMGLGSSTIPMDPHWEAGLAHPQPFEENWYNNAYLFDDTSSHVSPSHMHLPLTFPLTTPPTALPTIPPTIPTSDTGLGSSTIPMDPHWEAGLAHPQLFEENWYNNTYLPDDNSSQVSLMPMHPLSVAGAMPQDCQTRYPDFHPDHGVQWSLLSSDYNHPEALAHLGGQMVVANQGLGETTGILAGVLNRPNGADPSGENNHSHDSDTAWHSISVPSAGTVALEQLDGSSAGTAKSRLKTAAWTATPSPSTLPHSNPPPSSSPLDLILTANRKCNYIGPDGKACGRSMASTDNRNAARHWVTCHAMKELLRIREKTLDISQATIINSTARRLAAERYLAICPLDSCRDKGKPGAEFVREDSLIRHMVNSNRHKGSAVSKLIAKGWAQENMEVMSLSDEFGSAYEEAVSRIWHGR